MVYLLAISLQGVIPESSTLRYVKHLPFMRKVMGSLWFPLNMSATLVERQLFLSIPFPIS